MRFELNFKSAKPVYLQVVDQVKAAVASGAVRHGDALPSIRPLAEELRVNRNTIAKAYTELEHQGVITTESGRGCFVNAAGSVLNKDARLELVTAEVDQAVVQAHHLQIDRDEFLQLAQARFDAFAQRRAGSRGNHRAITNAPGR
jgi:GntR family transcriptional regulator